jgi:hypothetical protein
VEDSIGALTVHLDSDGNVAFYENKDDLPVFSRSWSFFPDSTVEAIALSGVTATLGPPNRRFSRLLRLEDPGGDVIFEESMVVYV